MIFVKTIYMINLLCIVILIIGGLNWASIGFLQYDFIAGFFGTQASIFSRLIYICVGLATLYFIFMMFKYKGNIKVVDRKGRGKAQQNQVYVQSNQMPMQNPTYIQQVPLTQEQIIKTNDNDILS